MDIDAPDPTTPGEADPESGGAEEDRSVIERMRGAGVGVEDPAIVGDPEPGPVDAEIAEDEPPRV